MTVTVKLIGPLVYAAGFSEKALTFPGPVTAGELLSRVSLAALPTIVTRNGNAVAPRDPLAEGDRVVISPIYSGG
jgi:sulfur carrier protein ThiS